MPQYELSYRLSDELVSRVVNAEVIILRIFTPLI